MLEKISTVKSFGGQQLRYSHQSSVLNCQMHFSIYLPPSASLQNPVPVIYWLSGLTCTDENFVQKAGAQAYAAQYNVAVVAADTSPRGDDVPDDVDGAWDFGLGAGFYVDATQEPWRKNYQMYSYIVDELPLLIKSNFPVSEKKSIMGHSMGGHGALTIALKNPDKYCCVSAFAPICSPMSCAWGEKAFSNYLGQDENLWKAYDTCELLGQVAKEIPVRHLPIWVEQGDSDNFLHDQLKLYRLQEQAKATNYPMEIHLREGYDHSYFFIATFIGRHIADHVAQFR